MSPLTKGFLECCSNGRRKNLNFSLTFALEASFFGPFPLGRHLCEIFARSPWSRFYIMSVGAKTFFHSLTGIEQVQFNDYIGENIDELI